jgi:deazaflavin-dependent oxidoreductase (nitroreductase family)
VSDAKRHTPRTPQEIISMPAGRRLARFNRLVTNRILGLLAPYVPGMGMVVHRGRKTQRQYRTPVLVFRRGDSFIIALTYGPETDWVRNVVAAGGCKLETRGRTVKLTSPRLFHDEQRRLMPPIVRQMLAVGHVYDFLELAPAR